MTAASNNVPPGELIRDHLLPVNKIPAETRRRLSAREFKTVPKGKVEEYEENGWVVAEELKTHNSACASRVGAKSSLRRSGLGDLCASSVHTF